MNDLINYSFTAMLSKSYESLKNILQMIYIIGTGYTIHNIKQKWNFLKSSFILWLVLQPAL